VKISRIVAVRVRSVNGTVLSPERIAGADRIYRPISENVATVEALQSGGDTRKIRY